MSSETERSPESEAIDYLRNIYDSENTPIDPQVPASRYMRSGPQMFRMAKQYESDGDIVKAYALYIKFTKFVFFCHIGLICLFNFSYKIKNSYNFIYTYIDF